MVYKVNLVESDHERGLFVFENIDGLDGLRLETVHNVDDQNGNVAQRRATRSQRLERLVTGRVDDEQTGYAQLLLVDVTTHFRALGNCLERHVGGAYLLRDAARLVLLYSRASQIVEYLGLARVYVTQHAYDRAAQIVHRALLLGLFVFSLFLLLLLLFK